MTTTIGQRLRAERERQGITRGELARYMGIGLSTLSDLELDLSKSTTKLHLAAERLNISTRWLETGVGLKEVRGGPYDKPEWDDVLASAQQVSLGSGAEADEYAETHKLKFRADSLRRQGLHAGNLKVYYAKGDSMFPLIRPGSALLFNEEEQSPVDGEVFIVQWRGELYCKRCEILDGIVFFRSDNPHGDHVWTRPKRMDAVRDPVTVLGMVRWVAFWTRPPG